MSFYEHTFVGKQDISDKDVNNIIDVCTKIIEKSGKLLKTEKWGILNLPRKIKNNKKGIFVHFKFESDYKAVDDIEKKLSIENKVIRYLTVKYKKIDLKKNYFEESKKE
tara:strand:+ start:324 stop:650 length:327 start_codon:yes stop_codon:yes gene_type:complete